MSKISEKTIIEYPRNSISHTPRKLYHLRFMEKAIEFLEPNILSLLSGDKRDTDKFISAFRKHMEEQQ